MLFFVTIGLAAEKGLKIFLKHHYLPEAMEGEALENTFRGMSSIDRLFAALVTKIPDIICLFVFFGTAYFSYFTFIWIKYSYLQLLFLSILLTITLTRVLAIASHLVFSPASTRFRILSISSHNAVLFHRFLVGTGVYIIAALMFTVVVFRLGAERTTISLLAIFFATVLLLVSAILVLLFKRKVEAAILRTMSGTPTWGRRRFASLWHVPAILYLALLWILLVNTIDSPGETSSRAAFLISFFVLPIWLIADRFIQWIVSFSLTTLKINDLKWHDRCDTLARACVVFALMLWVAHLWGLHIPFVSQFTEVFFNASVILALSLLLWQLISSWIERKIAESIPEGGKEDVQRDDEWGGAAAYGRSYTLLPMIRKFIGSILTVLVTMTILSSMGVDIGPLLAGAGVIGLAIGFGAQKLVADIFSGFFYLLDDAFRVGEYLEAGAVSGIVENITLRNVMLRHHRGMLQIVPHSELGAITNFMRGGIVVKFNLDFPYDADIDEIRKVIKKVGLAMLADEQLGKDFIKPLKSQGVREIANSVMTIRVKFTAQPGAHFVIRREAFKRITEALSAKGIQYAHRRVIVDIPAADAAKLTREQLQTAGAASFQDMESPQESQATQDGSSTDSDL